MWFSLVRRSCTIASSRLKRDAGRAPPKAVFNLLFRRHQQFPSDFRRGPSTRKRLHQAGSRAGDQPGGTGAARRLVPGDVGRPTPSGGVFEHARMIRPSGFCILLPPRCPGSRLGPLPRGSPCHASPRKPGWIKPSAATGIPTVARLPPSTGFWGVPRLTPAPRPSRTQPRALDDSTPVTIRACDASTHLPPRSRMTRPFTRGIKQALKRFRPAGTNQGNGSNRRGAWMTDFTHQPQHLLNVQPAGDAHERLFVVRAASVLLPGRLGRKRLRTVSPKYPALAGDVS